MAGRRPPRPRWATDSMEPTVDEGWSAESDRSVFGFEPVQRESAPAPELVAAAPRVLSAYEQIDAVNWSTLVHMATSAKLLAWRRDHAREETLALRIGTAIHCALLEPDLFPKRYVVRPNLGDGRTKVGKAARAEWNATIPAGAVVLDLDEYESISRCANAARAHPVVRDLLRMGRAEEIVTWHDEETGLACKGRLDYIAPRYLVDLKSTRAETLGQLAREIAGRMYHGQVSFYRDGAIAARVGQADAQVIVIAIQTVAPYDVVPARIQVEDLELGRSLYRSLLRRYAECQAANYWPGLAPQIVNLSLPEWAPSGDPEPEQGDTW